MFVLSDSNANRAYGTSRGFQLRACNAAKSAEACSSVSLQVWMVSGFTAEKLAAQKRKRHKKIGIGQGLATSRQFGARRPKRKAGGLCYPFIACECGRIFAAGWAPRLRARRKYSLSTGRRD